MNCKLVNVLREKGFTLIEVLIVLAIVAILSSFAVPALKTTIDNNQLRTMTYDLFAALNLARSEAIKRNVQILVTPTGGDWKNGWTVSEGLTVIRQQDALAELTVSGPVSVIYDIDGRTTNTTTVTIQIYKPGSSAKMKCISYSSTMRASILTDSDNDGDCLNG